MSRRQGFALISTLLLLAVLMALGAGAIFLSLNNLGIARNNSSNTIAKNNAANGLDLAMITAARAFAESYTLPSLATLQTRVPPMDSYVVQNVYSDAANELVIVVDGFGPSNAEHRTSARIRAVLTPVPVPQNPLFGEGFITLGDIVLPGLAEVNLNLWAGGNISLTGTSRLGAGYTATAGGGSCSVGSGIHGVSCPTGQEPPDIPVFDFAASLAALQDERPTCDYTITANGSFNVTAYSGQTVCVADGVDVTLTGTATDLYVLGSLTTTVRLSANVVPADNNPENLGIKLASGTVDLSDSTTTIQGTNTIYAFHNIGMSKGVLDTTAGGAVSRTLIATEGDVRLNGGGASSIVVSTFWVNGDWCVSGTLTTFQGSILARASATPGTTGPASTSCNHDGIRVSGSITNISYPPGGVTNPDIPPDPSISPFSPGVFVLARRP